MFQMKTSWDTLPRTLRQLSRLTHSDVWQQACTLKKNTAVTKSRLSRRKNQNTLLHTKKKLSNSATQAYHITEKNANTHHIFQKNANNPSCYHQADHIIRKTTNNPSCCRHIKRTLYLNKKPRNTYPLPFFSHPTSICRYLIMNSFPSVSDNAAAVLSRSTSTTTSGGGSAVIRGTTHAGSTWSSNHLQRRRQAAAVHATWGVHSPVVVAMLQGNRMNTCSEVQAMMDDCISSLSEDSICQTAAAYNDICASQNRSPREDHLIHGKSYALQSHGDA